jgi:hypothetical protein
MLCKDCAHFRMNDKSLYASTCTHPISIIRIDVIDGRKEYAFCYDMRAEGGHCDIPAKLFLVDKGVNIHEL